jgi:hypothetical protein
MRGMAQCGVQAETHLDSEEVSRSDVLHRDNNHKAGAIPRKASNAGLNAEDLDAGNTDQSCRWRKVLFRKVTSEISAAKSRGSFEPFLLFALRSRLRGSF